ncbi:MAG: anthranilate synthase component I family protein [Lachnospiraceae bacterium]|nr:anthranilate synthase component I family protein [Lachnospiraceae bacterium]
MKPDVSEIGKLAKEYPVVPVCREIFADMTTPILLLRKMAAVSDRFFLLESVEGGEKWGRYSFLGYDPSVRVSCKNGIVAIERDGGTQTIETKDPLSVVRRIIKESRSPHLPGMPPFTGGFVGYFGYAMIGYAEPVLDIKSDGNNDLDLCLYDRVIAFDHLRQKIILIANMKTDNIPENYGKAEDEIRKLEQMIRSSEVSLPAERHGQGKTEFSCSVTKDEYCRLINRTREYIYNGDIFQAVIARRFTTRYEGSLINAYRVLRTTNPSPYMVYLSIDGDEIMSTSPETLIRLENGRLTTFPVAGSRPRGKTEAEDEALEKELLADEKELSEHNMLVDLGRNDLGRICKFGSVEVTRYKMIHRYSKIMHICSQVEGDIRDDKDALDAIASLLPAGTLSGAPKIRACQIIDELENFPRGVYGGALGYVDLAGNMDTCIAIRMAVRRGDTVIVSAGGGIVADSDPEKEYEESGNKAAAVMNSIINASSVED